MKTLSRALALVLVVAATAAPAQQVERPRGWLGIFLDNDAVSDGPDGTTRNAVVVRAVVAEGPAAEAGLRARDRIVTVDGYPVAGVDDLIARIGAASPGTWLPVTVERGERERDLRVRLGTRPERTSGLGVRRGWIGSEAIDLPPPLRLHFGAPEESGVMVATVAEASPAEAAGLDLGDVVYEIGGEPVTSVGQFYRLVAGGGVGNEVEMLIMRNGTEIVLEATIEEQPEQEDDELE